MAKISGVGNQLSGKVGQITYAQTKYGTVAYQTPQKAKVPRRSEKQMQTRMQFGNLSAVYKMFNNTLKGGFENLGNMSVYNAFVQANMGVVRVYITKQMRLNGSIVLAPYQITRGTLPSIGYTPNADNVLVSTLNLGGLSIDIDTTVAAFSAAVIAYNDDYEEGDQITFFYGDQTIDAVTQVPRAKITGCKLLLDLEDDTPLWDVVGDQGFSSVDGYLAMGHAITDGAAAWIHTRLDVTGALKVSTQFLYVDSSVLESYQGDQAMTASADSYGGVNRSAIYLMPTELTNSEGRSRHAAVSDED